MSTLSAENLTKHYKSRAVVDNLSLQVNSGEVVGLLGPNGAGKTTSFYLVVGLVATESGTIWLDDVEITRYPMHLRARMGIGYLPQEASVFRKLSVQENILAILETRDDLDRGQQLEKTELLMHDLHIAHLRDTLGMSLSGGERRRVEIARALATNPQFILLDEPFAGVDPISVLDIHSIIKQLQELGIGILITDHNVRETLGICQRAYIVNEGRIIAEGSPEHILGDVQVREVYLGEHFRL